MKFFLTLLFVFLTISPAFAQSVMLIFDAETIYWLEKKAEPFLIDAGVDPKQVRFRLIQDEEVNAFVTSTRDVYFNTGLFLKASKAEEVIGVLAHEMGHIKGRHNFRLEETMSKASLPVILSTLAGIGATMAGAPSAGGALIIGGQALVASNFLKFSRSQEWQADRIALQSLNKNGYSAQGLFDFFNKLHGQELLYSHVPSPYLITHPLTNERVDAVRAHIQQGEKIETQKTIDTQKFERIQAKLFALTHTPITTLRQYNKQHGDDAELARTIAYALQGKLDQSLEKAMTLLEKEPENPFNLELVGQIYVDKGDLEQGINFLKQALEKTNGLPLLRLQLAEALMHAKRYNDALIHFERLRNDRPEWTSVVHSMALIYGKQGFLGLSHLSLAEESLMKGALDDAKLHLRLAKQNIAEKDTKNLQKLDFLNAQLTLKEEADK